MVTLQIHKHWQNQYRETPLKHNAEKSGAKTPVTFNNRDQIKLISSRLNSGRDSAGSVEEGLGDSIEQESAASCKEGDYLCVYMCTHVYMK
jgi:hypothetical protein